MPVIYSNLSTPAGSSAPDVLANANQVSVGPGTTEGLDPTGAKGQVTHGTLATTECAPVPAGTTAYLFVASDGSAAWLDPDPKGSHVPAPMAFRLGRAWKGSDGAFVVCQGRRSAAGVDYNIGGDPTPRRLIDEGSSGSPVIPKSPFQGAAGGLTLDVVVTVKGGGTATVQVVSPGGKPVSTTTWPTGNNQPGQVVLSGEGEVLEFTTSSPGTTITMIVTRGLEKV